MNLTVNTVHYIGSPDSGAEGRCIKHRYDNVTLRVSESALAPSEGYESVPFNVWEQRPE